VGHAAGEKLSGKHREGRLVDIGDTRLFVVTIGSEDGYPILILHGGPGLDHHEFGDYLDPLADRGYRLIFVDQRAQGRSDKAPPETWTLRQMASDVTALARALELERYAVLGESFGAFVALQHAVDDPSAAAQTMISGGVPSTRWLSSVEENLEKLEPPEIRAQVKRSWEKEATVETPEQFAELMHEQWPFHFADPLDPRIPEYERRTEGWVFAPEVLKAMSENYGAIEVEDRLGDIPQPVLLLAGRSDRVCSLEAHEFMAERIPNAELVIFEESGHMTFVEETPKYLNAVDVFLRRTR
jgi:proline iminopeptidase